MARAEGTRLMFLFRHPELAVVAGFAAIGVAVVFGAVMSGETKERE